MRSRVIALDLDGTLLTSDKTILPASLTALSRARAAGFQVIIVTGRHHIAIHPFYQELAPGTPVICCNGTYLYDYQEKKVLQADPVSIEEARCLTDWLAGSDIQALMYVDDAILYQHLTSKITTTIEWAQQFPVAQRPVFTQVKSLAQAIPTVQSIWKFALADQDITRLQQFSQQIARLPGLTCEWSWYDQIDVTHAGNSKGRRLAQWLATQGLSMDDVVAFGDNHNDLSMLEAAGIGVAMGNAVEAVKARADVVIGDNNSNSIADFIQQTLLSSGDN
ncbi:pyridoxal phosphatase [Enterobacteriaceae bacterium ESL0689]|nr:pyridoxal phosphatase [Enterobacteriaceae bacterium ESL0689]